MIAMVVAIVLIQAEAGAVAALGPELASIEGVAEVYSVAGDEDLVAIIRVPDHERVATVVTDLIAPLDGILSTRTLIAFRQYDPTAIDF
jgi:DNA-binding Lrp family transcriptional regulator